MSWLVRHRDSGEAFGPDCATMAQAETIAAHFEYYVIYPNPGAWLEWWKRPAKPWQARQQATTNEET